MFIKNGLHINDPYAVTIYVYRTEILSSLGRYQETYTQAQQIYDMYKALKHKDNEVFAYIYIEMARSTLGLDKVDKASEREFRIRIVWNDNKKRVFKKKKLSYKNFF